ncbi:hypothetical protein JCM11641_006474 [Rhodosporidiobolus odoratus]
MSRRSEDGFLSSIKNSFIPSSSSTSSSQPPRTASEPTASSSYLPNPSALLTSLAPTLLSPGTSTRLLHPQTISSHQASLTSSSSSSHSHSQHHPSSTETLLRKLDFLRAGLTLGRPNAQVATWGELSTQLYLRDRVDDLLRLEVPEAPFPFASSSSAATSNLLIAPAEVPGPTDSVPLLTGFRATIPASQANKTERRRRRAVLGERQLGIEAGRGGKGKSGLGLRERGERARGLLGGINEEEGEDGEGEGEMDEFGQLKGKEGLGIGRRSHPSSSARARRSAAVAAAAGPIPEQTRPELERDAREVEADLANLAVRRAVVNGEIREVEEKIRGLERVREEMRGVLVGVREEELELGDELEGIQHRLSQLHDPSSVPASSDPHSSSSAASLLPTQTSRRRKGPAFLPSEHDDLPTGVAFMTLQGHLSPLLSLDFSSPYSTLLTSSTDTSVRLWDLQTGQETGYLRGHRGVVKALQVEGNVAVTGGEDGRVMVWDCRRAEELFASGLGLGAGAGGMGPLETPSLNGGGIGAAEEDVFGSFAAAASAGGTGGAGLVNGFEDDGLMREPVSSSAAATSSSSSIRDGVQDKLEKEGKVRDGLEGPRMRTLDGHTKAVTSLYFDGGTLVTGSSDSTLRQWDLSTGQCVQTMDILWAISNPLPTSSVLYPASSYSPSTTDPFSTSFSSASPPTTPRKAASLRRQSSLFESPGSASQLGELSMKGNQEGGWEVYEDFVGGVMFWGYALASGTKDGCVRMWDTRTGQAHRTLVGHTAPVTCLQFDEYHLVTGSLDRSIRIWDLRTGAIADTLRYDHAVTALQFDSRKIVAAAGENGVKVYNRTTMQHTTLTTNGHTSPVERLRFMDKYLATGGRDAMVKIWALQ